MGIKNQEALNERVQILSNAPAEFDASRVDGIPDPCNTFLKGFYERDGDKYVLKDDVQPLSNADKFQILKCLGISNGIKLALVDLVSDYARLKVHFYNKNYFDGILSDFSANRSSAKHIFPISGGHRVLAGPLADQVQVVSIAADADTDEPVLVLKIKPIGDYSTYTLSISTIKYPNIDPIFNEIPFKFRPGCFNLCAPDWEPAPEPQEDPEIDYLAKDYESFRHTMITAMMQRVPGWQPTSEADLDQVLLELFSAAADELSDYQDRVMNEAYLGTARKRVSLARHARLMDYHIHQGNQGCTWLVLKLVKNLTDNDGFALPKNFIVWAGTDTLKPDSIVFASRDGKQLLFSIGLGFQNDLDSGNFSINLRSQFAASDITLSPNVSVSVKTPGSKWLVTDEDTKKTYFIRKEENQLKIYAPDLYHLHPLLNEMGLYTWNDSIPALKAGDTTADLKIDGTKDSAETVARLIREGKVPHLLIQEHLNPSTGDPAGRDATRRQLLRLLPEKAKAMSDPVTKPKEQWLVRVEWAEEDALKRNYCFTINCPKGKVEDVSLFHGNLIQVHHGRPQTTVFKKEGTTLSHPNEFYYEDEETKWGAICRLPLGPLAYKETEPGGEEEPKSTLEVEVDVPGGGRDLWNERISLIPSNEQSDDFVVETDELGNSLIRFGNGINGKELPDGATVYCTYQIGRGPDGNIGADKLIHLDKTAFPEIEECWNPFDVTNGRDPEPRDEIIRRVPEAYRFRQLRSVTLKDYVDRAQELDEVSRAAARYVWTGSWRAVQISIDPVGELNDEEWKEVRKKVARHLETVRLIGDDIEIREPRFIPLDITVELCIHPDYWPEDIRFILEPEFSDGFTPDGKKGFFHPDLWTFGQELRASQIIGRIQSVDGIEHVIEVTMKRWNEATPGTKDIIEVRANEIIQVKNDPDHLEKGFIFFNIQGGRQ